MAVVDERLSQTTLAMSRILDTRISHRLILSSVFVVFLVLVVARCTNYIQANVGFVLLNQTLATPSKHTSILEAVRWLENAEIASARRGLGFALAALDDEEAAQLAWKQAGEDEQDFLIRGRRAAESGNYETAVTWFERAIAIQPTSADAWYGLGLLYEEAGESEKAISAYAEGVQKPDRVRVGRSDFYLHLGLVYARLVIPIDNQTALDYYDQALMVSDFGDPQSEVQAHYLRAEMLNQFGLKEAALNDYNWVIQHSPKHYAANARFGLLLWSIRQDIDAAEIFLLRAVAINGQQKMAYRSLGAIYKEVGRIDEAIEMYQQILILDPTDPQARQALDNLSQ